MTTVITKLLLLLLLMLILLLLLLLLLLLYYYLGQHVLWSAEFVCLLVRSLANIRPLGTGHTNCRPAERIKVLYLYPCCADWGPGGGYAQYDRALFLVITIAMYSTDGTYVNRLLSPVSLSVALNRWSVVPTVTFSYIVTCIHNTHRNLLTQV